MMLIRMSARLSGLKCCGLLHKRLLFLPAADTMEFSLAEWLDFYCPEVEGMHLPSTISSLPQHQPEKRPTSPKPARGQPFTPDHSNSGAGAWREHLL